MKKLFYGLGAVVAVATPVVAVVSCGKAEPKKTGNVGVVTSETTKGNGNEGKTDGGSITGETSKGNGAEGQVVVVKTASEKFETTLNNVVSYVKTSQNLEADKQVKSVFINLDVLKGITNEWLLEKNDDGTWNNSFRQLSIDLFRMNGVNMTSWTDAELDNFIKTNLEKRTTVSQEDIDQAWNDLYGMLADQSSELAAKIENKDVEYAKSLTKDVVRAELEKTPEAAWGVDGAGCSSLGEYVDSVFSSNFMAKLELVSKGNSVEKIPLKDDHGTYSVDQNGVKFTDIVRDHSNLSIEQWVNKFKSLFDAYTGGKVDVFHNTDSITLSKTTTFATNNPRTPKAEDVLKTFKFDGNQE